MSWVSKAAPARLAGLERHRKALVSFIQFLVRRFMADQCATTASALTYTSLLALVPLMTIFFAIFQAFPAYHTLRQEAQRLLIHSLVPEVGETLLSYLNQFTSNAGRLTGFGVIGLAVTAVLLFSTIEGSFRAIWKVNEPRPLVIRLLAFWTILTLTPLLFGAGLSLSTALATHLPFGYLGSHSVLGIGLLLPVALEVVGFFVLYLLIPNRELRWLDALIGAAAAAVLLELSKAGFGWYIATFPTYQTIYGALSLIPIFLLWLYIAWSTVLIGAEVSAALPEWRAGLTHPMGPDGLLPSLRLMIALAVLKELLNASRLGVGLRRRTLLARIPVGAVVIDGLLERLQAVHWVARTSRGAWVDTRDLSDATLYDLMCSLGVGMRGALAGVDRFRGQPWFEQTAALLGQSDHADRELLAVPLKTLFTAPEPPKAD